MPYPTPHVCALNRIGSVSLALGLALWACAEDGAADGRQQAVIRQYISIVRNSYDDSIDGAKKLRVAIDDLIKKPSSESLSAAREAWMEARPAYLQTEAYRFYDGPIDDPKDGLEGRIAAWPVDEAAIDYARSARSTQIERKGIINDRAAFPVITAQVLAERGEGSRRNITTGYHALEFLLWGQDFNTSGPGERPFTDFVGGSASPDPDSDRRRQYLIVVTDMLIQDLVTTRSAWNDGEPYLSKFLANVGNQSLKSIVMGISRLSGDELADKRVQAAYESKDQEDEVSSFSDNTLNDLKYNLIGIENVYFGRYNQNDSLGLEDLVKAKSSTLDLRIKNALAETSAALAAIPAPFDQAIVGDAASLRKLRTAIEALDALSAELTQLNAALGL